VNGKQKKSFIKEFACKEDLQGSSDFGRTGSLILKIQVFKGKKWTRLLALSKAVYDGKSTVFSSFSYP
jgi:hypothetical protein